MPHTSFGLPYPTLGDALDAPTQFTAFNQALEDLLGGDYIKMGEGQWNADRPSSTVTFDQPFPPSVHHVHVVVTFGPGVTSAAKPMIDQVTNSGFRVEGLIFDEQSHDRHDTWPLHYLAVGMP